MRRLIPWSLDLAFRFGAWLTYLPSDRPPMSWALRLLNAADRAVLLDPVLGDIVKSGFRVAARSGLRALQADGDIYTQDWGFDLSEIHVPVHFWHGKEDKNIPWTYAKSTAAMIPTSTTHWTDEDGHYSMAVSRTKEVIRTALGQV